MIDRDNVISGLQYTIAMFLFDPATGNSKDPDDLNAADRITYDACVGAIAMLKEQEVIPVDTKVVGTSHGDMEFYCCSDCRTILDPAFHYCPNCGRKVKWE